MGNEGVVEVITVEDWYGSDAIENRLSRRPVCDLHVALNKVEPGRSKTERLAISNSLSLAAPEEDVVEVDTVLGWLGSYAI